MNIGVDARSMVAPRPRGTGRNLRDAFRLIPDLCPEWRFLLYHQRPLSGEDRTAADEPWQHPNVTLRRIDAPGDRFDAWFQLRLPFAARQDRVDLMHFPANAAPAWCPVPFVLTVHDLIPFKLPRELSPRQTQAFGRGLRRGLRRAQHVIVVSQNTRDDLHRDFGVPLEKTTVIPWAPDSRVTAETLHSADGRHTQRVRDKYRLPERWLIAFSGSTPRKNARGVLDGFARVAPDVRRGVRVVLVGCEPEAYRARLATDADRLGISDQCLILGFAQHEDLAVLLGRASGLLMPSRYEGFGLPILDAFACGVPVLTSNVSSMPEVAGDAAVYCDPHDPRSIAHGIEQLLNPWEAAALVQRGHERLALFSWERTAAAMRGVYEHGLARLQSAPVVGLEVG